jgi:phosphatidylinositol glycan class V
LLSTTNFESVFLLKISLIITTFLNCVQIICNQSFSDHVEDAFEGKSFGPPRTTLDHAISYLLDGFSKWDARYFLSIANFGYESEQWIAFFPLYPMSIRQLEALVSYAFHVTYPYSHLLAGYLISNVCFVISACCLFVLSVRLHRDRQFALRTVKWFCYNPAAVFFSACYTESMYSAFLFAALCILNATGAKSSFRRRLNVLLAGILLSCASFTRSNGITNVLFVLYPFAYENFTLLVNRQFAQCASLDRLQLALTTVLSAIFVVFPYALVQLNAYEMFCTSVPANARSLLCNQSPMQVYSYVQQTYWSVGFLRYYTWRKLPLFLLAMPITLIVLQIVRCFWRENRLVLKRNFLNWSTFKYKRQDEFWNRIEILLPYVIHLLFLTVFAWLCINVEVLTRLLASSSPLIYWALATFDKRSQFWTKWFCAAYFLIGIFMHTNFLPWT